MKRIAAYGISRSRDNKGKCLNNPINPYVNCIHTLVGGGWLGLAVLVLEEYDLQREDDKGE